MSYLTWKETGLDQLMLVQLTDDEGTGSVDEVKIEEAIADAEAEINSYAGSRYSVPFSSIPAVIKSVCKAITRFKLFARRPDSTVPDGVQKEYDAAVKWLQRLADGKVSIDGATMQLSEDERTASAGKVTGGERTFGRENLEDY